MRRTRVAKRISGTAMTYQPIRRSPIRRWTGGRSAAIMNGRKMTNTAYMGTSNQVVSTFRASRLDVTAGRAHNMVQQRPESFRESRTAVMYKGHAKHSGRISAALISHLKVYRKSALFALHVHFQPVRLCFSLGCLIMSWLSK